MIRLVGEQILKGAVALSYCHLITAARFIRLMMVACLLILESQITQLPIRNH